MKQYNVKITNEAITDMEQIYNYIALTLLAPKNAKGQYDRISDAILKLDIMPERFRIVDFEYGRQKELRKMPVDNFAVFYFVRNEDVIVTNVLYSASDIESRLTRL